MRWPGLPARTAGKRRQPGRGKEQQSPRRHAPYGNSLQAAFAPIMFAAMKRGCCAAVLRVWGIWAVLALSACSGKGGEGPSEPTPPAQEAASDRDAKRERALARLKARQQAACEQMTTILTDCAVAEARAQMSPKELAELDLENTAPRHRQKMEDECLAVDMSPRQVKVIESCLATDTSCDAFVPCLDAAQKQPQPAQPAQ